MLGDGNTPASETVRSLLGGGGGGVKKDSKKGRSVFTEKRERCGRKSKDEILSLNHRSFMTCSSEL